MGMGRKQGTFTSLYARIGLRYLARPPGLRRSLLPHGRGRIQLGGAARAGMTTKLWLLLLRWVRRQLNALSALDRRVMKAYLLLKAQFHRSPRAGCIETRFLKIRLYLIDFTREQSGLRVAMKCSFTIDCQRYEEE